MLVVDASVAIKWVVPETDPETDVAVALSLLERGLIAPELMAVEFANVMWKKVRRGEIAERQAVESQVILPAIVSLLGNAIYMSRAFEIAVALDHPFYDCLYLAVAEIHQASLITADKRLLQRCIGTSFEEIAFDLETEAWI
jgi:predicted nucleic acid-binding protein